MSQAPPQTFRTHALSSINHDNIYFYGASEYILGRLAGHALDVSMDSGSGFCVIVFIIYCCFCWWVPYRWDMGARR
jgi:hypothetical protein